MSFKGVLIIIGVVALGVVITFGVEELRFRVMYRALLAEVKTLQGENKRLQATNDDLFEEVRTLKAQLDAKTEEYQGKISQLEEDVKILETANQNAQAIRVEVNTLEEKNQHLQTKNNDLTKQIKTVKGQLETKTQEYEEKISQLQEERRSLTEKISRLEELINKARTILAPEE